MRYRVTLKLKSKVMDQVDVDGLTYKNLIKKLSNGSYFFKLDQVKLQTVLREIGLEFLEIVREPDSYYVIESDIVGPDDAKLKLIYREIK